MERILLLCAWLAFSFWTVSFLFGVHLVLMFGPSWIVYTSKGERHLFMLPGLCAVITWMFSAFVFMEVYDIGKKIAGIEDYKKDPTIVE